MNGSTAAEDTLQTFQEVQLEAAEDDNEENDEAAVVSPSSASATLDVPDANPENGGSERGERVKGEISMLSSPLQVQSNPHNGSPDIGSIRLLVQVLASSISVLS